MDYENITAMVSTKSNGYLHRANEVEIYENVVTHGPLDIKLYIGSTDPDFNDPESEVPLVKEYFKTS